MAQLIPGTIFKTPGFSTRDLPYGFGVSAEEIIQKNYKDNAKLGFIRLMVSRFGGFQGDERRDVFHASIFKCVLASLQEFVSIGPSVRPSAYHMRVELLKNAMYETKIDKGASGTGHRHFTDHRKTGTQADR